MAPKTDYFLQGLHILSWIIFIGLCIEAGGLLFNTVYTLVANPDSAGRYWMEADLSGLYAYNQSHYITLTVIIIISMLLKAIMFYIIVKLFYDKKLNLSAPFNEAISHALVNIAWLAIGIGLFSFWGAKFATGLSDQVKMPDVQALRLGGADVWIFMGVVLLVFARMFKKGVAIQNENQLTI